MLRACACVCPLCSMFMYKSIVVDNIQTRRRSIHAIRHARDLGFPGGHTFVDALSVNNLCAMSGSGRPLRHTKTDDNKYHNIQSLHPNA